MKKRSTRKGGRPPIAEKYGSKTVRINITVTEHQRDLIMKKYGGISTGIRALIDKDMGVG